MSKIIVAIDGPSGSGKSTIARELALSLGIEYLDTGAMYRALAFKFKKEEVNIDDIKAIDDVMKSTKIAFIEGNIFVDGEDVSSFIRSDEISQLASKISAIKEVREFLVSMQRSIGEVTSLVADGRDIGTNVFKNADIKFFMTADVEIRAKRRFEDLSVKDSNLKYENVLEQIKERDFRDTNRKINPLVPASDSILIDNTDMSVTETLDYVLGEVRKIWQ